MTFRGAFGLLSAAVVAGLLVSVSAAEAFSWGPARVIEPASLGGSLASNRNLGLVSCPSERLCVAVDGSGYAFASTAPLSATGSWQLTGIPFKGQSVKQLDCPSNQLCVAVTSAGDVVSTSNPAGPAGGWTRAHVSSRALVSLSCPSAGFCAAVDGAGSVFTSGKPAAGAGSWHRVQIGKKALRRGARLTGIACASRRFCLAVSDGGDVFSSRNPTGSARAWRHIVLRSRYLSLPVCPTVRLCLMVDENSGRVLWSGKPTGGPRAWHRGFSVASGAIIVALTCESARLCVGVDDSQNVFISSSPTRRSSWHFASLPNVSTTGDSFGVSCGSPRFCAVALGSAVATSATPTRVKQGWSTIGIDAGAAPPPALTGISCPTAQLCIAVDSSGNVLSSTTPSSQGVWSLQTTGAVDGLGAVSCAGVSLCVAVDGGGGAISATNLTGAPAVWSRAVIDPGRALTAVSCPSAMLCVAIDEAGNLVSSTNPTGGAGAWQLAQVDTSPLTGISCSSASLCVAADQGGRVLASTNPGGGAGAWQVVATDPNPQIEPDLGPTGTGRAMTVACAPAPLCVVGDDNGGLMSSTSPASGPWGDAVIAPYQTDPDAPGGGDINWFPLVAASCASNQLCAVIDNGDDSANGSGLGTSDAFVSSDPTNGNSWSDATDIGGGVVVNAVSCPSTQLCVAVDDNGDAIVGTGP